MLHLNIFGSKQKYIFVVKLALGLCNFYAELLCMKQLCRPIYFQLRELFTAPNLTLKIM